MAEHKRSIILRPNPLFFVIALFAMFTTSVIAGENRDWKQHPAIVKLEMPPVLYAMGDVHGDYDRMVELLTAGKLIGGLQAKPQDVRWTGGKAVLVVTGDFIDKYDQSLAVIAALRVIQSQAEQAGARVIIMLGNHEAEFLSAAQAWSPQVTDAKTKIGKSGKKSSSLLKELDAAQISPTDVAAGRDVGGFGAWMRDLPVAVKAGDWFFCHAGNTGGISVDRLETDLQNDITANGFSGPLLGNPNSILQSRMHPRQWWDANREVQLAEAPASATPPQRAVASEKRLRAIVEALGCKHLVIGHQPGKIIFADGSVREAGEVIQKFDDLLWMIDTGMSRGANAGRGALLKIETDGKQTIADALYMDGKTARIYP